MTAPEVNSLCDGLEKIAKDRNVIAHNPVTSPAAPPHAPKIVDYSRDVSQPKEITEADLEAIRERAGDAIGTLFDLGKKLRAYGGEGRLS